MSNGVCRFFSKLGVSQCSAAAQWLIEKPLKFLFIVVLAAVASRLAARTTRRFITSLGTHSALQRSSTRAPRRAYALASSAASVSRVIVWVIAVPLLLGVMNVNLGPFVAVTTVVGAALGFGAQSLVKDLLSGFMILAEDQYAVGDRISLPNTMLSGIVEDLTLMHTRVRADDGNVWFIANGEIREVANLSLDWARATVDVLLPHGADVDAAVAVASEEARMLAGEPEYSAVILSAPEAYADSMSDAMITMRVTARTPPGTSAGVRRALFARILRRLRNGGPEPAQPAPAPAREPPDEAQPERLGAAQPGKKPEREEENAAGGGDQEAAAGEGRPGGHG
jgi:small-conductance mechanosensitive channel